MINLYELLGINKEDFSKYKVHFATGSTDKKEPYIVSLIYYEKDIWMFGGIYRVLPDKASP